MQKLTPAYGYNRQKSHLSFIQEKSCWLLELWRKYRGCKTEAKLQIRLADNQKSFKPSLFCVNVGNINSLLSEMDDGTVQFSIQSAVQVRRGKASRRKVETPPLMMEVVFLGVFQLWNVERGHKREDSQLTLYFFPISLILTFHFRLKN